jgi:hypothetical protein
MRSVIDREVGRGRLTMRLDRDMDVWMQKELVGVFMSYGGRWLRLGLEVVLGKVGEVSGYRVILMVLNFNGDSGFAGCYNVFQQHWNANDFTTFSHFLCRCPTTNTHSKK